MLCTRALAERRLAHQSGPAVVLQSPGDYLRGAGAVLVGEHVQGDVADRVSHSREFFFGGVQPLWC